MIQKYLIFILKASDDRSIFCKVKPVSMVERIYWKARPFTFLVRNTSNEGVEAKVKGEWAMEITLKNAAINSDKRSAKTI